MCKYLLSNSAKISILYMKDIDDSIALSPASISFATFDRRISTALETSSSHSGRPIGEIERSDTAQTISSHFIEQYTLGLSDLSCLYSSIYIHSIVWLLYMALVARTRPYEMGDTSSVGICSCVECKYNTQKM